MKDLRNLVIVCVASALLAACAENGLTSARPQRQTAETAPASEKNGPALYVLNSGGSQQDSGVAIYSNGGSCFSAPIYPPYGPGFFTDLAADTSGHVFIALLEDGNVHGTGALKIFSKRGTAPAQILHQKHPFFLPVLDGSENLYNLCAEARVCEYAAAGDQRVVKQEIISLAESLLGKIPPNDGASDFSIDSSGELRL